jgi:hypothetical protein
LKDAGGPNRKDRKEACRNEGSFICETDVREVQGDQEERQNHDHLREPEAQAKTGLITDSQTIDLLRSGMRRYLALTIYDEKVKPADAGQAQSTIVLITGSG